MKKFKNIVNIVNKFYLLCKIAQSGKKSSEEYLNDPFLLEDIESGSILDSIEPSEEAPAQNIFNPESNKTGLKPLPRHSEISTIDETGRSKIKKKDRKTTKDIGVMSLTSQQLLAKLARGSKRARNNILSVYNFATEEEKNYWGIWYVYASQDVQRLASYYGVPFEQAAAVVAVLSPGNKWKDNLMAAAKIFSGATTVNAYPENIRKANQIKNSTSGYFQYVTGPKVSVFLQSLLAPEQINKEIVLDSHAINIWFGKKVNLKLTPTISEALRQIIIEDYKRVAAELGIKPMALQAVTWYVWKYLASEPSPKSAPKSVKNPESKLTESNKEDIF